MKLLKMTAAILLGAFAIIISTGLLIQRNNEDELKRACAAEIHRVTRVAASSEEANAFIASDPMVRAACSKVAKT